MSETDLEPYSAHYRLLGEHDAPLGNRLSLMINHILRGPSGQNLQGAAYLLTMTLEDLSDIPPSIRTFQAELESLASEIGEIITSIVIDWHNPTDESITNGLKACWEKRAVGIKAVRLAQQISELEADLRPLEPNYDEYSMLLNSGARHINAAFDMVVNPDKFELPQELIYWHKTLYPLRYAQDVTDAELKKVIEASHHSFQPIRFEATGILGNLYDERSIFELLRLAHDSDTAIRDRAISSIGSPRRQADERIINTLITALADPSDYICGHASRGLSLIKNRKAVPALIAALNRPFKEDAFLGWIGSALAEMPDERALEPLIEVLEKLMSQPLWEHSNEFYPIAGIRQAIQAIGGERAEEVLKRYFPQV